MKNLSIAALLLFAACSQPSEQKSNTGTTATTSYSAEGKTVTSYVTADSSTLRLSKQDSSLQFKDFGQPKETEICVFVDPTKTYQTLLGIGGALTDASAETFAKLPADKQQEVLQAYFNPDRGIGYTLARTNIHSCDFSSGSYTYIADNDTALKTFSIDHDKQFRIPFIKQSIAAAGGKLALFGSPWSPPAWMKDNNDILHGGKLKPEYYQSWANYYVKFIQAYEKEGIPVWGISVQNEPMATQKWESCIYTAEEERDFIKKFLGPTLHSQGMSDKKLIAWDHNRDLVYQRASTVLDDPEAAKYVWGIGFHWYETWTGGTQQFENVKRVEETYPATNLMLTEGCNGPFDMKKINDWQWGEIYGNNMLNDFNSGAVGWTDWNILLDETGGPNHVNNFCFAPVHGDTKTGQLYYQNAYYYIGHFSKFIRPGAKRIITSSNRSQLQTTGFLNTDGKLAIVVLNTSDKKFPYRLWIGGKVTETTSLSHSIMTLIVQ
jgi:glucosylceramidase